MPKQDQNPNNKYDLEERTAIFAEDVIVFLQTLPFNPINKIHTEQITRSSGSICANYCEADAAQSKKDFRHKIALCKKESKETRIWIRLLAKANPKYKNQCRKLWQEAHELLLIFSAILNSGDKK